MKSSHDTKNFLARRIISIIFVLIVMSSFFISGFFRQNDILIVKKFYFNVD